MSVCVLTAADGNSRFGHVLISLPKPGGGEYGKYYSLPALNDPRIGKLFLAEKCCGEFKHNKSPRRYVIPSLTICNSFMHSIFRKIAILYPVSTGVSHPQL